MRDGAGHSVWDADQVFSGAPSDLGFGRRLPNHRLYGRASMNCRGVFSTTRPGNCCALRTHPSTAQREICARCPHCQL